MKVNSRKVRAQGKMPHFTVRLSREAADALMLESSQSDRTISETLRVAFNRHLLQDSHHEPVLERLSQLHGNLRELGRDLETVTRLFLVSLKLATEADAKDWCKLNLRAGR